MNEWHRATPEPPRHLSPEAAEWWRQVVEQYELDHHHLLILGAAAEELDTAAMARDTVAKEGGTYIDRYGQPRPHPMLEVARKARNGFRLLVRELGLDVSAAAELKIPPYPGGR